MYSKSVNLPCEHGFYGRVAGSDDLADVVRVRQVHGATCLRIDAPIVGDMPEADAIVTTNPDLRIGVITADCAPVLFYANSAANGTGGVVVGAAHAGWFGAFSGVLEATLLEMMHAGAKLADIRAAVGPCIGRKSYEVSADFEKPFIHEDPEADRFFAPGKVADKRYFDLGGYCAYRLARAGVTAIDIVPHDTYVMADTYYSHRRGTHAGVPELGRQLSVVSAKIS